MRMSLDRDRHVLASVKEKRNSKLYGTTGSDLELMTRNLNSQENQRDLRTQKYDSSPK